MRAPVLYARSGDVHVAYQITGAGPVDVVLAPANQSHLELAWESPRNARLYERLGSFSRLIRFDKRGTGLSDRPGHVATLEERVDDIRAVMDAAGSERAAIIGVSEGGSMACLFAASNPDRTRALVLWGTQARWIRAPDYPWGDTAEEFEREIELILNDWPPREHVLRVAGGDTRQAEWLERYWRAAASPSAAADIQRMLRDLDIRTMLPAIRVPTLVVSRSLDNVVPIEAARDLAARIPGARFEEFPGSAHFLRGPDFEDIVASIEEFVTGIRPEPVTDRVLATVLFADVVGSTELVATIGDAAWGDLLSRFHHAAAEELRANRGVLVDLAGEGLLATFDGPARAVRCARALQRSAADLGMRLRAGVHTGEVERVDSAIRGIAVHIASRIAGLAGADEILVSTTVRDLVAGSGITFVDRGTHTLKGVPDRRQVLAVASP
jgi:class 3 adenylate cyclase/esterase/lipase